MSSGADAVLEEVATLLRRAPGLLAEDLAPQFDPYAAVQQAAPPPAAARWERDADARATDVLERSLAEVERLQPALNMFTSVFADGARADAADRDAEARLGAAGPLHGVTVAVKDLFDVAGVVTLAGSTVLAARAPAVADAVAVARLRAAGALVLGATTMDEFAYGFTTENSHYGPTRNPHDPSLLAGGSSGGSAAAVAAGVVRIALGTDTNGSIRVPAAFCGVYGLRPTFGLVPRTGALLFASSFDVVGPLARTPQDIALAMDVLSGPDGADPACTPRPRASFRDALQEGAVSWRAARAGGDLWEGAEPVVTRAAMDVSEALEADRVLDVPDVPRARGAAIIITAAEGAAQHHEVLVETPELLDPRTRGRFLAGLDVPAVDYVHAQRFRRHWQQRVLRLLEDVDVLVVPTVACTAPAVDAGTVTVGGAELPAGAVLGRYTQPLSFIGLPSLSVPVVRPGALPVGVQLVGRPGQDRLLVAAAAHLHDLGITSTGEPAASAAAVRERA